MKSIIEYKLQDGTSVFTEVDLPDSGVGRVSRGDGVIEASMSFEAALDQITPAAESVIAKLRALSARPDAIELAFGIKLSGKLGAIIASGEAEANFQVTLSWNKDEKTSS